MHKTSFLVLGVTILIVLSSLFAPVASVSSNACGSCHSPYYQYLDISEGNGGNQIPSTISVGETKIVSVVVENLVNAPNFNVLSSVSVTLNSKNGHFQVTAPTFNIGYLSRGTETATWEIKGISVGEDSLILSASAINTHENLGFSDNYLPAPSITVTPEPIPEFPSTYVMTILLLTTVGLAFLLSPVRNRTSKASRFSHKN